MDAETRLARKVGAQRVAQHAEAQRAKGLARVPVWVPADQKERLMAYAARLRIAADLLLPSDRRVAALLRYGIDPAQEESKTPAPGPARQTPETRGNNKPGRKRKRRSKGSPSAAKPAKKAARTQEQNQPKTPKKKRNQRRRQAQKAARSN